MLPCTPLPARSVGDRAASKLWAESRVGLGCAKVVLSAPPICRGFISQLPSNASTSPFSPDSGEKVADRPYQGAFGDGRVRENPPHPALSPKSFAATLRRPVSCSHANDLGERGHYPAVRTAHIQEKRHLTKSNTFAQAGWTYRNPRQEPCRGYADGYDYIVSCLLLHFDSDMVLNLIICVASARDTSRIFT